MSPTLRWAALGFSIVALAAGGTLYLALLGGESESPPEAAAPLEPLPEPTAAPVDAGAPPAAAEAESSRPLRDALRERLAERRVERRAERGAAGFGLPRAAATVPLEQAVRDQAAGVWVEGEGTVVRVLRDDLRGRRHQRFVLAVAGGGTLLVAHNTQLAPRAPVEVGQRVRFRGRYEWNPRGGAVHWTHDDPRGRAGGWIEVAGVRYE